MGPKIKSTFDARRDGARVARLLDRVVDLMSDGEWRTLDQISEAVGGQTTSISARLREVERAGYRKESEHVGGGLWRYRIIPVAQRSLFEVPPANDERLTRDYMRKVCDVITGARYRLTRDEQKQLDRLVRIFRKRAKGKAA